VASSVRAVLDAQPDLVVAVGGGSAAGEWDETAGGTLRPYGVDLAAGGRQTALPLSLTIAAWLLDEAGWRGPRRYAALPDDDAAAHAEVGRRLAQAAPRVAILAMGDGSAKRSTDAPGYLHERAGSFDAAAIGALAAAEPAALLGLSRSLAAELWVAGLPAWQALAGALTPGAAVEAAIRYDDAPRGVGYFVVDWSVGAPPD
jgi:hypothetical protein